MSSPEQLLLGAFLGEDRGECWPANPAGVLGLPPEASDADILAALERDLHTLAAHPFGNSPEATEVRLLLRQCAAQVGMGQRPPMPAAAAPISAPVVVAPRAVTPPPPPPEAISPPAPLNPQSLRPAAVNGGPPSGMRLTGLEREAVRIIAQHGGATQEAVRAIGALAHAKGLPQSAVGQTLSNIIAVTSDASETIATSATSPSLAAPRAAAQRDEDEPRAARTFTPVEDDSGQLLRNVILWGGLVAVICIIGVIALAIASFRKPSGGGTVAVGGGAAPALSTAGGLPGTSPPSSGAPAAPTGTSPTTPVQPSVPSATPAEPAWTSSGRLPGAQASINEQPAPAAAAEADAVLRDLRRAGELISINPSEARQLFARSTQGAQRSWPAYDAGQRTAQVEAIIDFLYRESTLPGGGGSIELLAAPAKDDAPITIDQVWPSAWSAGVLLRVSRERELPSSVVALVQALLVEALGPERPSNVSTFAEGVALALRRMPARIIDYYAAGPQDASTGDRASAAMLKWEQAAMAASLGDAARGEAEVLDGLRVVLQHDPDSSSSRAVYGAIESMVTRRRWRAGEASREQLLSWFDDPRVSSSNLALVTQTLVARTSADNIDPTMVLSSSAGPSQRAELRQAFAKAWSVVRLADLNTVGGEISGLIDEMLSQSREPHDAISDLAWSVRLALFTESLVLRASGTDQSRWRGALEAARNAPTLGAPAQPRALVNLYLDANGGWALRYLSERQPAGKLQRLSELTPDRDLNATDAQVLAEAALLGSGGEIKAAAQRIVSRMASNPTMIYGVLAVLPRSPRTVANIKVLESITGRVIGPASSDRWMLEARRALVERVIELVSAPGGNSPADRLAATLAQSYFVMAGQTSAQLATDEDAGGQAVLAAAAAFAKLRIEAEKYVPNTGAPLRLDQLDRRRLGRLASALGPIQQFAAEQVGIAEALAYVVSGEQPGQAAKVQEVIDRMQTDRRAANHVFTQIRVTQGAILELWVVRTQGGSR